MAQLSSRVKRRYGLRALLCLVFVCLAGFTQEFNERQVKAVFLFNFAQFVEWPDAQRDSFVIGLLGDNEIDDYLVETVRGERIGARPFSVEHYASISEATNCQVLFIGRSEARQLGAILSALKNRPILTVSDLGDFARHGGMIEFVKDGKHVKLAINVEAARVARLTISSKLLRPATIVGKDGI